MDRIGLDWTRTFTAVMVAHSYLVESPPVVLNSAELSRLAVADAISSAEDGAPQFPARAVAILDALPTAARKDLRAILPLHTAPTAPPAPRGHSSKRGRSSTSSFDRILSPTPATSQRPRTQLNFAEDGAEPPSSALARTLRRQPLAGTAPASRFSSSPAPSPPTTAAPSPAALCGSDASAGAAHEVPQRSLGEMLYLRAVLTAKIDQNVLDVLDMQRSQARLSAQLHDLESNTTSSLATPSHEPSSRALAH